MNKITCVIFLTICTVALSDIGRRNGKKKVENILEQKQNINSAAKSKVSYAV